MKRFLFLGIGSALMFTMGGVGPATADAGPHVSSAVAAGTTNFSVAGAGASRCAGCHRAHTAKGVTNLLKSAQPDLCYSCHKAGAMGSSTDVANGKDADTGEALRGGGFDFALINSGGALKTLTTADPVTGRIGHSATIPVLAPANKQATTSKHQINGTTAGTIWGNGAISAVVGKSGVVLECGSCHDPHGNGNYRILKPIPNDSGATVAVNIPDAVAKVYTTADYWKVIDPNVVKQNVGTAAAPDMTDGYIANASQWCSTCHTRYLAGSSARSTALTDATGAVDANFTYRHRSDATTKGGVERPNCIQCHVSHGSNASMSGYAADVTAPDGTAAQAVGAPADSRLLRVDNRGTCVMCHNV